MYACMHVWDARIFKKSLSKLSQVKTTLDTALENIAAGQLSNQDPKSCLEKNVIFPFVAASLVTFGFMFAGALFIKYFKKVKISLTFCFLSTDSL